ncbi:glycosyltransferase family 2 protein [Rudaeicoccus suwonensis]|uniref:4,4'-diaponeurosporenoate glycosyltransferase n=1 Tax=Rudaeicoccus suwonensis TaxID=657409 RepID=A0A561DX55_9MICO|nr:glycosyltransferase family A protein [Rudaeicoccus suwonensis]TWE07949.1 glycosyl transferase family 2 [Rudaeicoccus suwonensis]
MSQPTVSVVIPTLDEQDSIRRCLDRLLPQADTDTDIVIVDNGSTDDTVAIVESYAANDSRVRLIHESARGVAQARTAGFEAATGELLARIDADTLVPPGWLRGYRAFFTADHDHAWACAIGRGTPYGVPLSRFRPDAPVSWGTVKPCRVTFGANMMLRRSAWDQVKADLLTRQGIYEDVDLGLCLRAAGLQTALLTGMTVGVSPRRWFDNPIDSWRYLSGCPRTFYAHGQPVLASAIYAALVPVNAIHTLRWIVLSAYDEKAQRFSYRQLRTRRVPRVLP